MEKFFGYFGEVDAGVFKVVERGVEVEVADVKAGKAGIATIENTVKDKFGEFKGANRLP